jgi:hypothetical protein
LPLDVESYSKETKMPRGGKRPGAGRKPGSKTKKTMDIALAAAAAGESPLEFMLRLMRDPAVDDDRRADMAKSAAPYCHSRLNATTLTGKDDSPLTVEIRRFTYPPDDADDAASGPRPRINLGGYSADDVAAELANARARLVEMQALPLLPGPDLD